MQQTFKTELQKQREERDMKIYLDFEEMRSVPGSSKTEVAPTPDDQVWAVLPRNYLHYPQARRGAS